MASYIGCPGLILIVLFIVFLFLRRKKLTNELTEFYRKNQFYTVNEFPASILQALGKGNWQCLKGSLVIDHKPFEFY